MKTAGPQLLRPLPGAGHAGDPGCGERLMHVIARSIVRD